jgi:predicted KAP-like P-loop ATPase
LASIAAKIEESGKFNGKTVYMFIDELDRCKPPYAIELLETLKHLFSVNGLVFVLAANYQQLEQCVAATYGYGVDRHRYL